MFWFTLNGLLNQAVLRIGKPIKINNNLQTPFCSTYLTYFELAQCIKAKQSSCTLSLLPNLYSCVKCSGNWEVSKSKLLFLILLTFDKNVSTVFILMHTASPNDSADEGNKVRGLGFEVVRRASRHMILFFLTNILYNSTRGQCCSMEANAQPSGRRLSLSLQLSRTFGSQQPCLLLETWTLSDDRQKHRI